MTVTLQKTTHTPPRRFLVVNADDFGQSSGVNRGIITAHEEGIVTSASLMVRWPAAAEAAWYARSHRRLSVGLHLDFGEWTYRDGEWVRLYEVIPGGDDRAVRQEVVRQLEMFRSFLGRDPSHIDSHQHVHREEPVRGAVMEIADSLEIPVRHLSSFVRYCGSFYGQSERGEPYPQGISVENLSALLTAIGPGVTELSCHPGIGTELETQYCAEREVEVETLCDPRAKEAIVRERIIMCTFDEIDHRQLLSDG